MISLKPIPLRWKESGIGFEPRLAEILEKWRGTPYMLGQQTPGVGVDCVRFVTAVWDELLRRPPYKTERLPMDAALNNKARAQEFMRLVLTHYAPIEDITEMTQFAEPGDLFVTRSRGGGPGHVIIVGPRRNTVWQAGSQAVAQGGWSLIDQHQFMTHHFRFGDRQSWPTQSPS